MMDGRRELIELLTATASRDGRTFVHAATIANRLVIRSDAVECVLRELEAEGEILDLQRHGDGWRMTVVRKAGAW